MKKLRGILTGLLLAVFIGSGTMALYHHGAQVAARGAYAAAAQTAQQLSDALPRPAAQVHALAWTQLPEPVEAKPSGGQRLITDANAQQLLAVDIAALQEVNPDVLGWILIPGTAISYPLLQGEDNRHYLNYTWNGWESPVGAIFMECQNDPALTDFNTMIYGHYLYDGSMFAGLHSYKDQTFWEENPYVYIADGSGAYRYRIYGAKEVTTTDLVYMLGATTPEHKQLFIENSLQGNQLTTGIAPTAEDRILTLSTCTGYDASRRWVVQAVLEGQLRPPAASEEAV